MESCEICGQPRSPEDTTGIECSGPCGGTVHARCAARSGIMLSSTTDDGLFWFCDRCRREHRRVTEKNLPELPAEMWTEIFQRLSAKQLLKVRRICRRWRDIVDNNSPLLAKLKVCLSKVTIDSDYAPVHLLPVTKVCLRSVTVAGVGPWWSSFGQGLTEIVMCRETRIDVLVLVEMLRQVPNLKCLELIDLIATGDNFTAAELNLSRLEKFCLDGMQSAEIFEVFQGLRANLKCLSITWESFYNTELVEPTKMASFVGPFQGTLEDLAINCSNDILVEMGRLDRMKLKKLSLQGGVLEDNTNLMEFLRKFPSLEYLDVEETLSFVGTNQAELDMLGELLPQLKFISFFPENKTPVDLTFLSKMPKLQNFSLNGCGIDFMISNYSYSNLTEFYFSNVIFPPESLRHVLESTPKLHTLTVNTCQIGRWSDLLEAVESRKHLRTLTLVGIYQSTVPDKKFSCDLSQLRCLTVNLSELTKVTTYAMQAKVLSWFGGLRQLNLQRMVLGDEVLHVVFRMLPKLTLLGLESCMLPTGRSPVEGLVGDLENLVGGIRVLLK